MKRFLALLVVGILTLQSVSPASARLRRVVVRGGPRHARTVVVVHRGFPLRRHLPLAYVRPARVAVLVTPAVFLAPIVWRPAVVTLPEHDLMVWEDSETLSKDEDWTEITLTANDRGTKLYMEIVGKMQLNYAEVVFENGDTRVVDFNEKSYKPGIYSLLDFRDGRKVDHVRMVAKAKSDEAKVILRMEK